MKFAEKLILSSNNIPLGAVLSCKLVNCEFEWGKLTSAQINSQISLTSSHAISRLVARIRPQSNLYPENALQRTEVDHWLTLSTESFCSLDAIKEYVKIINSAVAPSNFLVGNCLTIADLEVFATLYKSSDWQHLLETEQCAVHALRWYNFVKFKVSTILDSLPADILSNITGTRLVNGDMAVSKKEDIGKFVELPGAKMGEVVVRFPPEASGYLHIGHAKAALLNQHYKDKFKGKLILRFDDTNPAKEDAEFEKVILEDLKLLNVSYDKFSFTSDYFDEMLNMCNALIKEGKAYVDDTDAEQMKKERDDRKDSKNRNNSIDFNLKMFDEMKNGTLKGQMCCVRAKIDMRSNNGCMRDPTIYRCKDETHPRMGNKYKVYPTYDFACPIVDSLEGVTHALRTTEYHDRDEQYYWFIKSLNLRTLHIYEYSRLNMTNTVLSKRKLRWFVNEGLVDGWDDPRFPTVRAIVRRGMTVEGLKDFILAQGSSRSVVNMEWDKIWAFNRRVIDRESARYTALQGDLVPVFVNGAKIESKQIQKHPKDNSKGTKVTYTSSKIWIEEVDAKELKEGVNATFINWGNFKIKKVVSENGKISKVEADLNLSDTDYKKTLKVTWLPETTESNWVPITCSYFDHLISKNVLAKDEDFKNYVNDNSRKDIQMYGESELANLRKGEIVQIQRKGFFIADTCYDSFNSSICRETRLVLFYVPDGHTKDSTPVQAKKDSSTMNVKNSAEAGKNETLFNKTKALNLCNDVKTQGDKVRLLKSQKTDKSTVLAEVNILKSLKLKFKDETGLEYSADMDITNLVDSYAKNSSNFCESPVDVSTLDLKIVEQGDKIRKLKLDKAEKEIIKTEVNTLLALKKQFSDVTNLEWKPTPDLKVVKTSKSGLSESLGKPESVSNLYEEIKLQGDKIRKLKASNVEKSALKSEVDVLLNLKKRFKELSDLEWKPDLDLSKTCEKELKLDIKCNNLSNEIAISDSKIRKLGNKTEAPKNSSKSNRNSEKHTNKAKSSKEDDASGKKQTRLCIEACKEENLADWYSQVITKSEMIEYYNVSGCYILRPWSYAIWEFIKDFFDKEIKKLGVQNAYFPIFVSKDALEKEKSHLEDFSPEVAWVTRYGSTDMAEPVAIRPTSETVMYPAFAKWIQSHRDLPIKINQWNNVVRWEFKQPTPFLRTREFLWQEGHSAFATLEEAVEEVHIIADLYAQIYQDLMAIPIVKGKKTSKEKFAGADFSITAEAFISASGRGIQGATSHHLGQNFAKMVDIIYEDPKTNEKKFVYQNSWGITTRTIGVMVMVHGDDKGLVLPPRIAPVQVVIMPVGITASITEKLKTDLITYSEDICRELCEQGIRAKCDLRDNVTPAWKFNHWELKGVPIRLEVGPRELSDNKVYAVRRDNGDKQSLDASFIERRVFNLLESIHEDMFKRAKQDLDSHTMIVHRWNDFVHTLNLGNILLAPFCGIEKCEDEIKKNSARDEPLDSGAPSMGAKSLCVPFEQPGPVNSLKCINPSCSTKPEFYTLFGRSY